MKPKYKIGQKVKVKLKKTIISDIENKKYGDSVGIMDSMIFGRVSIITGIGFTKGRHFADCEDPDYRGFNYMLTDCHMDWWYGEDFLELTLNQKINKILKV